MAKIFISLPLPQLRRGWIRQACGSLVVTPIDAATNISHPTAYTKMFAVSTFVGTPMVAAPVRATKTVRSTATVAAFGKKPAAKAAPKKAAAKKAAKVRE